MSNTRYNPDQFRDGRCFNSESEPDFADITDAQREQAADYLDSLIEQTRRDLEEN